MQEIRRYYLIRHGKAANAMTFRGPGVERPLTERGEQQTEELALRITEAKIEAIYASPAKRCVDTAGIIARTLGLEVVVRQSYLEGRSIALPEEHQVCAIVAHGDNIPALLYEMGIDGSALKTACAYRIDVDPSGAIVESEYLSRDNV